MTKKWKQTLNSKESSTSSSSLILQEESVSNATLLPLMFAFNSNHLHHQFLPNLLILHDKFSILDHGLHFDFYYVFDFEHRKTGKENIKRCHLSGILPNRISKFVVCVVHALGGEAVRWRAIFRSSLHRLPYRLKISLSNFAFSHPTNF